MANENGFKDLKDRFDKISSTLDVLTRQKGVLQEVLREVEKAEASLSKDAPPAAADNKAAKAVLDALTEKYKKDAHNNERKIVEKATMDYGLDINVAREAVRTTGKDVWDSTETQAAAAATLAGTEQVFKDAKAAYAGLSADLKARAANVKKLAADAQRASDGGMDDEALIITAELQDAWKRLKHLLNNGSKDLSDALLNAQTKYTEAATAAQTAKETLLINTGLYEKAKAALEAMTNPQTTRDAIKLVVAELADNPPDKGAGVLFDFGSDELLMPDLEPEPPPPSAPKLGALPPGGPLQTKQTALTSTITSQQGWGSDPDTLNESEEA